MRILVDTHILIWWMGFPKLVPKAIRVSIEESKNQVFVSAVSAWEIAFKTARKRLEFPATFLDDFDKSLAAISFSPLNLTTEHAVFAGRMLVSHKDPFDRLIAGQAICEYMALATVDSAMREMGASVIS